MSDDAEAELLRVAREWDEAMVSNDADAIAAFMAEEWLIVGTDGSIGAREQFVALVRSGLLTHDVMTTEDVVLRVYGNTAVLIARGVSGGMYAGHPFREEERASNIFVKSDGRWRCVLTHLSRLVEREG